MKALTIRQPFAWLVVNGFKDVENRSWATSHRGPLLIHAGKKPLSKGDKEWLARFREGTGIAVPEKLPLGGIVGVAILADCVTRHRSPWFRKRPGNFGWVFKDAKRLPFRPMPGKLKVWEV